MTYEYCLRSCGRQPAPNWDGECPEPMKENHYKLGGLFHTQIPGEIVLIRSYSILS